MVTMAGLQVFVVRFFFQGARKGEALIRTCVGRIGWANWWRRIRVRGLYGPVAARCDGTTNMWRRERTLCFGLCG